VKAVRRPADEQQRVHVSLYYDIHASREQAQASADRLHRELELYFDGIPFSMINAIIQRGTSHDDDPHQD
jgi:hypothetical protein